MSLVIDASVTVSWGLADEDHPIAHRALDRLQESIVWSPRLGWYEVRNTLLVAERRGRIEEAGAKLFLDRLNRLPISFDDAPVEGDVMSLARRHRLTVYDAAYLELASRLGVPIATLDRALASAAAAAGVGVLS